MMLGRRGPDTAIRFDLEPDEGRALCISYLVSTLLAVTWLTLVHVMRVAPLVIPTESPIIRFEPVPDEPMVPRSEAQRVGSGERLRSSSSSRKPGGVRDAFRGDAGLVDAGRLLRGVEVSVGGTGAHEPTGRKVGLETGVGSRTPGMTRTGGLPRGSGTLGTVGGNGVSRNAVTIAAPEVRAAVAGAAAGDAVEVGQTARAHVPQLERCYHQEGLTRNPALAGLVRLSIDVERGRVTSARILDRTWRGAGVAEAERCLVAAVRGWRLGSANAHIVLPLSFTSP